MFEIALLNPVSRQHLTSIVAGPPHALLIAGPNGIGKSFIATYLAETLLGTPAQTSPYFRRLPANEGIQAIREIQSFISLKVANDGRKMSRIVVIEDAEQLSIEAQNALLKMLEEPTAGTMIVVTTNQARQLLPTIRSRCQLLELLSPGIEASSDFFSAAYDTSKIRLAYLISGGMPGTMHELLAEDEKSIVFKAAEQARQILRANLFERLAMVDTLTKQKDMLLQVIQIVARMASAAMLQQANAADPQLKRIDEWQKILTVANETEAALLQNGQPKLVLTNAFLRL